MIIDNDVQLDIMMIDIDILLAWGATYKKIAANETIFREDTEGYFYCQLVTGSVRWININDDGREFIQSIIEPGESFGELPLFDGDVYAASAVANKDSVILRLHKATFLQLLKEYPAIHFAFSKLLSQRLRFKFLLLKELSCCDPEHRIATLFNYFKESNRNISLDNSLIKLTRQQVANMTGLRVETVIRSIRKMKEKGSLKITHGKVYC